MATAELSRKSRSTRSSKASGSKPRSTSKAARKNAKSGLKIERQYCPEGQDPFDTVNWEVRSAGIKDENGNLLFEQNDCEVPEDWSQLATNVVVSKYFYGEPGTDEREHSVRQLIHRVTRTIADWGIADGYFATAADGERFYKDLSWLCLHQHGAFNSPVWFNVGLFHEYGVTGDKCTWNYNPATENGRAAREPV